MAPQNNGRASCCNMKKGEHKPSRQADSKGDYSRWDKKRELENKTTGLSLQHMGMLVYYT